VDERYFVSVEDVDLCRLRRGGWRVAYEPPGTVTHLLGVSTAGRPYRMIAEHHRSLLRFTGPKRAVLAAGRRVPDRPGRAGHGPSSPGRPPAVA